jgi:RNA polymerase sigma factor (sigma-70 family)
MDNDTDLGGPAANFPATHCSIVRAAGDTDPAVRKQAFAELIASYWKPVYKYIRIKWHLSNEDAKDLTQGFFARSFEKDFFARFDPGQARFRTFLRTCLDGFVASDVRDRSRLKRGGAHQLLSLDFHSADEELKHYAVPAKMDLDDFFHQEWVRGLFSQALDELRRQCQASGKQMHFALFQRYDLEGPEATERPTYGQLAAEFGLPVTQVTNYLAFARRQFRLLVLERLRATTGSEEEFQQEARQLFGGEIP